MSYRYSRLGRTLTKQDLRRDMNAALLLIEDEIDAIQPTTDSVLVTSLQDLPAPIGGVITLNDPNASYHFKGAVDITPNRIRITAANVELFGLNPRVDMIVGSTTSPLVETTRGVVLDNISIRNPAGVGLLLDGAGTDHALLLRVGMLFCDKAATIQNCKVLSMHTFMTVGCNDGLDLGSCMIVNIVEYVSSLNVSATGAGLRIPAGQTFLAIMLLDSFIKTTSGQTGLSIDPGTTLTTVARVEQCVLYGGGTTLSGITKGTPSWLFRGNSGILDSKTIGSIGYNGTTTVSLPTPNTYTAISGSYVLDPSSERFSMPSSGVLQYDGVDPVQVNVSANVTVKATTGSNHDIFLAYGVNGVVNTNSAAQGDGGSKFVPMSTTGIVTLNHGDQIRLYIRNATDTTSMDFQVVRLRVF